MPSTKNLTLSRIGRRYYGNFTEEMLLDLNLVMCGGSTREEWTVGIGVLNKGNTL